MDDVYVNDRTDDHLYELIVMESAKGPRIHTFFLQYESFAVALSLLGEGTWYQGILLKDDPRFPNRSTRPGPAGIPPSYGTPLPDL